MRRKLKLAAPDSDQALGPDSCLEDDDKYAGTTETSSDPDDARHDPDSAQSVQTHVLVKPPLSVELKLPPNVTPADNVRAHRWPGSGLRAAQKQQSSRPLCQ
jgi:hypothetical protein